MYHVRYHRPSVANRARLRFQQLMVKAYRWTFPLFQQLGFHVIPNHYTQPVPDTRTLPPKLWEVPSQVAGVDLRESAQLELLGEFEQRYAGEYAELARGAPVMPYDYFQPNQLFDAVDAEMLYCMVRHFRPNLVLEVGSGFSTLVAATAVRRNHQEGQRTELHSIEPNPHPKLTGGVPGLTEVVRQRVQDVDFSSFAQLRSGDILFIDSSHIVQIGSDVHYLFLEVIPRLAPGVLIHVHDVFIPAEYPKSWVLEDYYFWNEQYLLQAFLAFNDHFEVLWAGSFMHLRHPERLAAAFPSYRAGIDRPGSFWFRRVA